MRSFGATCKLANERTDRGSIGRDRKVICLLNQRHVEALPLSEPVGDDGITIEAVILAPFRMPALAVLGRTLDVVLEIL